MTDFKTNFNRFNAGSKADGVNFTEMKPSALESVRGGEPVSIRKRGYHRALKSGKEWAIIKYNMNNIMCDLTRSFYYGDLIKPNPFLKLTEFSWLPNNIVPVEYFGLDRTTPAFRLSEEYKPSQSLWSRIKSWFRR